MEIRLGFPRGGTSFVAPSIPQTPEVASLRERGADCPGTVLELMTLNDKNDTSDVHPVYLSA